MYDDLFLFIKVAHIGSFTKAAKELNIYQSTISRRIVSLEQSLGIKLIVRTANHFELTAQGQQLFESLNGQEASIQNKIYSALENREQVFGELKVMLPRTLTLKIITPRLPEFMNRYPKLKLRILHQNHEINLQKDNFDFAIVWNLPDQQAQKVKLIHRANIVSFCTPQYVEKYGLLNDIKDINKHNILVLLRDHGEIFNRISLHHTKTNQSDTITINSRIFTNSYAHNIELVNTGEYISTAFDSLVKKDIANGRYIKVLQDYTFDTFDFYMLKRVEDDYRINIFADFIEECFKDFNN